MKKVEKQVIAKVKSMQRLEAGDREAENKRAFSKITSPSGRWKPHPPKDMVSVEVLVWEREGENFLTFVLRKDLPHNPI